MYQNVPTLEQSNDNFYDICPKLSEDSKTFMDAKIKEPELLAALLNCADSAPGSDGLSYRVYNKTSQGSLWDREVVGR